MKREQGKSLATVSETSIVGPNDRERLFHRLEGMKKQTLTTKERERADAFETACKKSFVQLCWNYFGISRDQIRSLPEKEFRALEKEIGEYAKSKARLHVALALFPIVGWLWALDGSWGEERPSAPWTYVRARKALERYYGKEYSLSGKLGDLSDPDL